MSNGNKIEGVVEYIRPLFQSDDFKIMSVKPKKIEVGEELINIHPVYGSFVIKGNAPANMIPYSDYKVILEKQPPHPKYGDQYQIIYIGQPLDMSDKEGQQKFLQLVLTESQLESVYDTLDDPFNTIASNDIEALMQCKGIGRVRAEKIIQAFKESQDYSTAYVALYDYGLTGNLVKKIVDHYGSPDLAVEKITTNPYVLATEIKGVGFKTADEIALASGNISPLSHYRLCAFIETFLEEQAQMGMSWLTPSIVFGNLINILNLDGYDTEVRTAIQKSVHILHKEGILWYNRDKTRMALCSVRNIEKQIAQHLMRLNNADNKFDYEGWEVIIQRLEEQQGWEFTEQQLFGIEQALKHNVVMVTGYGGTGKTSIVSGMLETLSDCTFIQGALSGRAGARLAEVTGKSGHTIHRMLEYNPESGFERNEEHPLTHDIIIIDELSMVGAKLFLRLLEAIPTGSKLIMICDTGQLESIGLGNVAVDIIQSNAIKVVQLTQIHRQAQKSAIVTSSLAIRQGKQIVDTVGHDIRGELNDLELDIYNKTPDNPLISQQKILQHFKKEFDKVGRNPMDVQVAVPMRQRGHLSTLVLNNALQEICNPLSKDSLFCTDTSYDKQELVIPISKTQSYTLRVNDKVINTVNQYEVNNIEGINTPVYNGDIGILTEINSDNIIVDFLRIGKIVIPIDLANTIELAYALTVHKLQGSECRRVVVGIDYSAYMMLSKEWVYTAITRAKEHCVLVAELPALQHAIRTSNVQVKQTFLQEFLQDEGGDK